MRILLTDDHALIRRGLKQVLQEAFGKVFVGEAQNATEALDQIRAADWDAVVLDITMPGRSGLDILRDIKLARPALPVLVLSMHPEEQFARPVLKSGAAGFVAKQTATEELVQALRRVLAGGKYVSPALAEKLANDLGHEADQPLHEQLSDREYQIMLKIALGLSLKEIAAELSLSIKTVSTYRMRVFRKAKFKTTADLVRYAVQEKLVA